MTILIIGGPDEVHSAYISKKLHARGEEVFYLDTRLYPGQLRLSFEPGNPLQGSFQAGHGLRHVPFHEIRSVYWRYHLGYHTHGLSDPYMMEMAHREMESLMGSFFRALNCLWVNSADAIEMHKYKGYQLQLMSERGLRVPHTLMTNNAEHVKAFYDRLGGNVIFKPVRGGAHTEKLKPEDLSPDRLKQLAMAPVQFQEMIAGVDVRVYFIDSPEGGDLYAAEIQAQSLDFRDDPGAPIVPIELPDAVADDCRTLAKTLQLKFSGIDVRKTPDGEYVFIEGNPSPMFMHFEQVTGYPISERLCDLLQRGPERGLS